MATKTEDLSSLQAVFDKLDDAESVKEFDSVPFSFEADDQFCQDNVLRTGIADYADEAFLLENLLTPQECQRLIDSSEELGFEKICGMKECYRSCTRIVVHSQALADILCRRVLPFLKPIEIRGDPSKVHIHGVAFAVQGRWQPHSINPLFRLCRYTQDQHFGPHFDGHFVKNGDCRSMQTLMLYLNGPLDGGSTNFIEESQLMHQDSQGRFCAETDKVVHRVHPREALGIIFNHHRLHEGERLRSGVKYILRTDLMFARDTAESGGLPDNQSRALEMMQEAERLEARGESMAAVEFYRKAFKLCPELEECH